MFDFAGKHYQTSKNDFKAKYRRCSKKDYEVKKIECPSDTKTIWGNQKSPQGT